MSTQTRIGLVCFDGMEELDLVGPWEVLRMWQLSWPEDGAEVFTMSLDGETVTCAKGMQIVTERPMAEAGPVDVIVYPGGRGHPGSSGGRSDRCLAAQPGRAEAPW